MQFSISFLPHSFSLLASFTIMPLPVVAGRVVPKYISITSWQPHRLLPHYVPSNCLLPDLLPTSTPHFLSFTHILSLSLSSLLHIPPHPPCTKYSGVTAASHKVPWRYYVTPESCHISLFPCVSGHQCITGEFSVAWDWFTISRDVMT